MPFASTVAIFSSEEVQVTVLAISPVTVTSAVRVASPPTLSSSLPSLTSLPVMATESTEGAGGTTGSVTVTVMEAVLPPAVAVTVAVPALTAFTRPVLSTVTASPSTDHETAASSASVGVTVAVSFTDLPVSRANLPSATPSPKMAMDSTGTVFLTSLTV